MRRTHHVYLVSGFLGFANLGQPRVSFHARVRSVGEGVSQAADDLAKDQHSIFVGKPRSGAFGVGPRHV